MSKPVGNPDSAFMRRFAALEAAVEALQTQGMLANSAVRAFLDPSSTTANRGVRIVNSSNAERARLGISEAGLYGLSVLDSGGVNRAQFGDISSGGVGFELRDASNNLIADSTGLAAVMKQVANQSFTTQVLGTPTTSFVDVSGSVSSSFSLARSANILLMWQAGGAATAGAANSHVYFKGLVRGAGAGAELGETQWCQCSFTTGPPVNSMMGFVVLTASGATNYELALQVKADAAGATGFACAFYNISAFLMGG